MYPPGDNSYLQQQIAHDRERSERAIERLRQQNQLTANLLQAQAEFAQRRTQQRQDFIKGLQQEREQHTQRLLLGMGEAAALTASVCYLQNRFSDRNIPKSGFSAAQPGPVPKLQELTDRLTKNILACLIIDAPASWWFIAANGATASGFPCWQPPCSRYGPPEDTRSCARYTTRSNTTSRAIKWSREE